MAAGDKSSAGNVNSLEILTAVTAVNSPPVGAGAGVAIADLKDGSGRIPAVASLVARNTAGSGGGLSFTGRIWLYSPPAAAWITPGIGAGAAKGFLNNGDPIDELGANTIRHAEPIELLGHFTRIYAEITAIAGTDNAISMWLCTQATEIG